MLQHAVQIICLVTLFITTGRPRRRNLPQLITVKPVQPMQKQLVFALSLLNLKPYRQFSEQIFLIRILPKQLDDFAGVVGNGLHNVRKRKLTHVRSQIPDSLRHRRRCVRLRRYQHIVLQLVQHLAFGAVVHHLKIRRNRRLKRKTFQNLLTKTVDGLNFHPAGGIQQHREQLARHGLQLRVILMTFGQLA